MKDLPLIFLTPFLHLSYRNGQAGEEGTQSNFVDVYYYMENGWLCDNIGTPESCPKRDLKGGQRHDVGKILNHYYHFGKFSILFL